MIVDLTPEIERITADVLAIVRAERETDAWPGWMSAPTAARYLDVPVERIYKLVQRREIPYSQPGAGCKLSFEKKALDDWMRGQGGDA